jgi:hypothetical protein
VKYDDPYEPFKNKDARLHGSIVVPGGTYKGITLVMQGGLITKSGEIKIYRSYAEEGKDGNMYYTSRSGKFGRLFRLCYHTEFQYTQIIDPFL